MSVEMAILSFDGAALVETANFCVVDGGVNVVRELVLLRMVVASARNPLV